jgi:xanthine/uracil/vitamin C permease (AzgA family)
MDLAALFDTAMLAVVLTFFFIVVFDNTGTLIGVARAAGMMQPDGSLPWWIRRRPWPARRSAPRRQRATSRAPPG